MRDELCANVAVTESVRAGREVTCIFRGAVDQYLLLGADDDLQSGIKFQSGGRDLLADMLEEVDAIAQIDSGERLVRDSGARIWSPLQFPEPCTVEYEVDGDIFWLNVYTEGLSESRSVQSGAPVVWLMHHDDDSWLFIAEADLEADDYDVFPVTWEQLVSSDDSLLEIRTLPAGWSADRENCCLPWRRKKLDQDDYR